MVTLVITLSLILLILILYKNSFSIWLIPIYTLIIDLISGFVMTGSKIGTIRSITLLIAIIFSIQRRNIIKSNNSSVIFLFIIYLVLISINTSNFPATLYGIVTISIIFLSYIWGSKYLVNATAWKLYFKSIFILALSAIIYIAALQLFDIETTVKMNYSEFFNTGGLMASRMDTLAFISIFILYIVLYRQDYLSSIYMKYITVVTLGAIWLIILINLKRTTILLVLIGVFLIIYKHTNKKILLKYTIRISIILISMFYVFQDIIIDQFQARENKFQVEELSEEYRFKEAEVLFEDINKKYTIEQILFGKNLFYTQPFGLDKFGKARIIHSDLTAMIYGAGIIGAFLYSLIFFRIFINFRKLRIIKDKLQASMFLSIFFMVVFVNIPGGFHDNITGSIIALSILGGISNKFSTI